MNTIKHYQASQVFPVDADLIEVGRRVLESNMKLNKNENLLIVADPTMEAVEAAIWFEAGKTITNQTTMLVFSGMTENAQEPPDQVAKALAQADVALLHTTYSLSHTKTRKKACATGTRIATLPGVSLEIIKRTLAIDYHPVAHLSEKLAIVLADANHVHMTSPGGTNLKLSITDRPVIADSGFCHQPGSFGNLPAGETFVAPVEGSANGLWVVDGSFAGLNLDKPIHITVKAGLATKISGGKAAQQLERLLGQVGPEAHNIAELGFGTNPQADPKGKLIEAEKALGTVHLALGNNAGFGGTVATPFHSDGVILNPTVFVDGKKILQDGKYTRLVAQ